MKRSVVPVSVLVLVVLLLLYSFMSTIVVASSGYLGIAVAFNEGESYDAEITAEPEIGEVVELRGQTSKTYYLGDGKYTTQARLGPAHYQDSQGDWQEIDNAWVPSVAPWDWQMVEDDYGAYALSSFMSGQILEFERQGSTVAFQPKDLQWTNNLSMIQSISIPQDVPVALNNTPVELLSGMEGSLGTIRWADAYGSGRHFEWVTAPGLLQTLLQLDVELPPPDDYIINGGDPVLRLSFIFAPSSDLAIYVNGILWDKSTPVQTIQDIEFRSGGQTMWYFRQAKYWDSSEAGTTQAATTKLRKVGQDLWLDVLVPYDWLQSASYPVFIDPDTGATLPGLGSNEDRAGLPAWLAPNRIETLAQYAYWAETDSYSDYLRGSQFGFSVPTDATILGVKLDMSRMEVAGAITNSILNLVDNNGNNTGSSKHNVNQAWAGTEEVSYGGDSDLWGATLTPAIVNSANFGARMSIHGAGASGAGVYWYKITVYYTPAAEPDISVDPTTYSFGIVTASSTPSTSTSYFTITNASTMQTDQTISVTTTTWSGGVTWTHSDTATPGVDTAGMKANRGGTWGTGDIIVKNATPNFIYENCPATTNYSFGLKLWAPTEFTDGVIKEIVVRVTAVAG